MSRELDQGFSQEKISGLVLDEEKDLYALKKIKDILQKINDGELKKEKFAAAFMEIGKIIATEMSSRSGGLRMDNQYDLPWHALSILHELPEIFCTDKSVDYNFEKMMVEHLGAKEADILLENVVLLIKKEELAIKRRKRDLEGDIIEEVLENHHLVDDESKIKSVNCISLKELSNAVSDLSLRKGMLKSIKLSSEEMAFRNRIGHGLLEPEVIHNYEKKVEKFQKYLLLREQDFENKINYRKYESNEALKLLDNVESINYLLPKKRPIFKKKSKDNNVKNLYLSEISEIKKEFELLKEKKQDWDKEPKNITKKNNYLNILSSIVNRMNDFSESDFGNFNAKEVFSSLIKVDEVVIQKKTDHANQDVNAQEDEVQEKKKAQVVKNKYAALTALAVISIIDTLTEQCKNLNFTKPELVLNEIAYIGELVKGLPDELQEDFHLEDLAKCRDFIWHRQISIAKTERYDEITKDEKLLKQVVDEINTLAKLLPEVKKEYISIYTKVIEERQKEKKNQVAPKSNLEPWKNKLKTDKFKQLSSALDFFKLRSAIKKLCTNLKKYGELKEKVKNHNDKELKLVLLDIGEIIGLIWGGHRYDFAPEENKIIKSVLGYDSKIYRMLDQFREVSNMLRHTKQGSKSYNEQYRRLELLIGDLKISEIAEKLLTDVELKIEEQLASKKGSNIDSDFDELLKKAMQSQSQWKQGNKDQKQELTVKKK